MSSLLAIRKSSQHHHILVPITVTNNYQVVVSNCTTKDTKPEEEEKRGIGALPVARAPQRGGDEKRQSLHRRMPGGGVGDSAAVAARVAPPH
jgi:hypothetical protein